MPDEDLRDAIKTMMVENLMLKVPKEQIGDNLPLFGPDGLGLDSIDALEIVVSLEKKVSAVSMPNSGDRQASARRTVNFLHDYMLANHGRRRPPCLTCQAARASASCAALA